MEKNHNFKFSMEWSLMIYNDRIRGAISGDKSCIRHKDGASITYLRDCLENIQPCEPESIYLVIVSLNYTFIFICLYIFTYSFAFLYQIM